VIEKWNLWNKGWCDRTRSRGSQGSWKNVCKQCYRRRLYATFLGDGRGQYQPLSNRCFSSLCRKILVFCHLCCRLHRRNGVARKPWEQSGEWKWETKKQKVLGKWMQALFWERKINKFPRQNLSHLNMSHRLMKNNNPYLLIFFSLQQLNLII